MLYFLKLTLAGVLQSYGTDNTKWAEFHDTELLPTQSAIIGLIACALGIHKNDTLYSEINRCNYYCIPAQNVQKLYDFQIVAPREYKKNREDSAFWKTNGSHSGEQLPIYKAYINSIDRASNIEFTVFVGSDNKFLLQTIYNAFQNPKWAYYLGRACCTPSKPIIQNSFELFSEEEIYTKDVVKCIYI